MPEDGVQLDGDAWSHGDDGPRGPTGSPSSAGTAPVDRAGLDSSSGPVFRSDPGGLDDLPSPSRARHALASMVRWEIGTCLDGDFVIEGRLGFGGMGVVYSARQLSMQGRLVAVKVMKFLVPDGHDGQRFRREIAALCDLDHPAIVPVISSGEHQGQPYYVMKLVPGLSLQAILHSLQDADGPPGDVSGVRDRVALAVDDSTRTRGSPPSSGWESSYLRWVARLGATLAEALQHAHDLGLVHRDVKPGNVLIGASGHPVLLDFGLASQAADETLTRAGEVLGTPNYSAPEQLRGDPVDERADIYSLGVLLYQLLTLRSPRPGHHPQQLLEQIQRHPVRFRGTGLPIPLQTILGASLAAEPAARYASAQALADDLHAFLDGAPIQARPPSLMSRARLQWRRTWRPLLTVATAGLGILGIHGLLTAEDVLPLDAEFAILQDARGRRAELALVTRDWEATLAPSGLRTLGPTVELASRSAWDARAALDNQLTSDLDHLEGAFRHTLAVQPGHPDAASGLLEVLSLRMQRAFANLDDVLHPEAVEALRAEAADLDRTGQHAALTASVGRFRFLTDPPGARVVLFRYDEHGQRSAHPVETFTTPRGATPLAPGSYVAEVDLAGHAPLSYPFIVRLPGADPETAVHGGVPAWSDVHIELLPASTVHDGWVIVAAGWSVVGERLPLLRHVDTFLMRRCEVTRGEWARFLESGPTQASPDAAALLIPRPWEHADHPHQAHCSGPVAAADEVASELPVTGMHITLGLEYCKFLHRSGEGILDGHYVDLPREAEWERACRGADGRRLPWGHVSDLTRCVSDGCVTGVEGAYGPRAVGSCPDDRSPFGIQDMAGNVAEILNDRFGDCIISDCFVERGGSYAHGQPRDFTATARRQSFNEPRAHAGLRPVQRPLSSTKAGTLATFTDTFEWGQPDASGRDTVLGNGWSEHASHPVAELARPDDIDTACIQDGRLVLQGGMDNASHVAVVLRRLEATDAAQVFEATLSLDKAHPTLEAARGLFLRVYDGDPDSGIQLNLLLDGRLRLGEGPDAAPREARVPDFERGRDLVLQLTVLPDRSEASAWMVGGDPPPDPMLTHTRVASEPFPLLAISAGNLVGVTARIEDFSLTVLE